MSGLQRVAWLLGIGVLMVAGLVAWQLLSSAQAGRTGRVGDGRDPATYGFALDLPDVFASTLTASGLPRDGLHALDHPPLITPAQVDSLNKAERGKYLVSNDLVIGIVHRGVARAWPLRVMGWHEAANDTVGGLSVMVAWSPLAGTARVFESSVDGRDLEFVSSGLLAESMPLFYTRNDTVSLWSSVSGAAVSGPAAAAAQRLQDLPSVVCNWSAWREMHPETKVPWPDPEYRKRYQSDPYFSYRHGGRLRFPVTGDFEKPLGRRLIVQDATDLQVLDTEAVVKVAGQGGVWNFELGSRTLSLRVGTTTGVETPPVWIEGGEFQTDLRSWPIYDFAQRIMLDNSPEASP
jgi:hypothetical protein